MSKKVDQFKAANGLKFRRIRDNKMKNTLAVIAGTRMEATKMVNPIKKHWSEKNVDAIVKVKQFVPYDRYNLNTESKLILY